MEIRTTGSGIKMAYFEDHDETPCAIQELRRETANDEPQLRLGVQPVFAFNHGMTLNRALARELADLLDHFADYGILPDNHEP